MATGTAKPDGDIVVTKWIALEGTSIAAKEREEQLRRRFPAYLVETAKGFDKYLSIIPEAAVAGKSGVWAMTDVTEGGIFGALWEMAESSGVGLEIDLKKLPIRQETVEICNLLDLNPYELISGGCLLIAAENGADLVRRLEEDFQQGNIKPDMGQTAVLRLIVDGEVVPRVFPTDQASVEAVLQTEKRLYKTAFHSLAYSFMSRSDPRDAEVPAALLRYGDGWLEAVERHYLQNRVKGE